MRAFIAALLSLFIAGMAFADGPGIRGIRDPFVTLMANVCLKDKPLVCDEVVITDSDQASMMEVPLTIDVTTGKPETFGPMPFSLAACTQYGEEAARKYLETHGQASKYFVAGWGCKYGNKKMPVDKRV